MRIALGIEYVGTNFYGWQAQVNLATVQGFLEAALSKVAHHPVKIFCAGRTDTGVHAIGQVVHFDTSAIRLLHAWVIGANNFLPDGIAVQWAEQVDDDFHARFAARARRYCYIIYNHPTRRPAILANRVYWYRKELDIQAMQAGAHHLLGEHDFSSFRASQCDAKSPVRTLLDISVKAQSNKHFIYIEVCANAFLQHMVRNLVGSLLKIGLKQQPSGWLKEVLEAKDRRAAGSTAPACGLYLTAVTYIEPYVFPKAVLL